MYIIVFIYLYRKIFWLPMRHIFLDMFGAKMERQVFGALCYLQGLAVVSCQMLSSQMLFCFCFFTQININIINIIIT